MKILTIGRNTFRENIRDKILYNLILFALLMILSSIALGLFTLLVNVAIMAAGLMLTLLYQGGIDRYTYLNLLPAIYLTLLSLMVTTALALVFSTFSTPALSALFTFFLWVAGHFNADLLEFGNLAKTPGLKWLTRVFYYVIPNISNFKVIDSRK